MPADFHSVGLSEANYFIALTKVDSCVIGPQSTASHCIFRLDGVELAGQRRRSNALADIPERSPACEEQGLPTQSPPMEFALPKRS
jgi:hypothetical protein